MKRTLTDERLERAIGTILRIGVIVSTFFVLSGGLVYLSRTGVERSDFRAFHGEPARLTSVPEIARGALSLDWAAWIQLGLVLLIATPVVRVLFSIFAFAVQRDTTYIAITLIVAGALFYSFYGAS